MRRAKVTRTTKETDVTVAVNLDGTGTSAIETGIGFFDHMLDLLARHSGIDITVKAKGDLHIDHHHTTEDVGIALGQAVKQALGDMRGITRYADVHLPMDEALTRVAIDISGRPFLVFKAEFGRDKVGAFDTELVCEWFQAFAINAGVTLHVELCTVRTITISRSRASRAWRGRCAPRSQSTRVRPAKCPRPRDGLAVETASYLSFGESEWLSIRCMSRPGAMTTRSRTPIGSCSCATASRGRRFCSRRCGCCDIACGLR